MAAVDPTPAWGTGVIVLRRHFGDHRGQMRGIQSDLPGVHCLHVHEHPLCRVDQVFAVST
ncbi:hypothetical protein [Tunturiibacter gelidiferens]|uniref:hypothetical protein n=1 Tax=Tunturiibacter gelidiferens TaxID=3069689 RepID=UPI003D9BAE02